MQAVSTLLATLEPHLPLVAAFAAGAALSALGAAAVHRRKLSALGAHMRARLEEHLETFHDLEERVGRLLQVMNDKDEAFRERLGEQREQLGALTEALAVEPCAETTPALLLDEDPEALPELAADDGESGEDLGAGEGLWAFFDALESQAGQAGDERLETVDEHTRVLESLAERMQELGPVADTLLQREREVEGWKTLHGELERTARAQSELLGRFLDELQPLSGQLADEEGRVELWRGRLAEVERQSAERQAELQSRLDELAPLPGELDLRESELAELRGERERLEQETERLSGEVRALELEVQIGRETSELVAEQTRELELGQAEAREGLEAAQAELGERRASIEALEAELEGCRAELVELTDRCAELHPLRGRVDELDRELGELGARLVVSEERSQELEGRCEGLDASLEASRLELEATREAAAQAESQLAETEAALLELEASRDREVVDREALQGQLDEREQDLERQASEAAELQAALDAVELARQDLEQELGRTADEVSSRDERIEELAGALQAATGEAATNREAMLEKLSVFKEAQGMLDAMRPMLEGLESTIKDHAAEDEAD